MRRLICLISFILVASITAFSFTLQLSLKDLVKNSQLIVIAEVIDIDRSVFTKNKDHVYTKIKLDLTQVIKGRGQKGDIIEIKMYGGVMGDKEVFVLEAPSFYKKEKVMLFLEERTSRRLGSNYIIYGMNQGKFSVEDGKIFRDSDYPLFSEINGELLLT